MTTEIIHVSHSFRADRELCELGEDWPLIQQTDEMLKNVIAKLELIEARANSEESKRKAYELRQAIGDGKRWSTRGSTNPRTGVRFAQAVTGRNRRLSTSATAKRLAAAQQVHRAIVQKVMAKPVGKIKSRGFDKTRTKRFSGQVEKRG